MKRSTIRTINLVSVVVIVVMLNLFAMDSSLRLDLTENKAYTLSDATTRILDASSSPITVKIVKSPEIPMPYAGRVRYFTDLVKRYDAASSAPFTVEVISPGDAEELKNEANRLGIPGVQVNAIEGDGVSVRTIYMGAVVLRGDERQVLPVIANIQNVEMELTRTIRNMGRESKPKVAFIDAGGSFIPGRGMSAAEGLLAQNYEVVTVRPDELDDPSITAAVLAGPRNALNEAERYAIESFNISGKAVAYLLDAVDANARQGTAQPVTTGLEPFLAANGITLRDELVMDARSTVVNVSNSAGGVAYQTAVRYPFFPEIIDMNRTHPVTASLQAVNLIFASPLVAEATPGAAITELAYTSPRTAIDPAPYNVGFGREFAVADFNAPAALVALAVDGTLVRSVMSPPDGRMGTMNVNGPGKMVVISDAEFANDNFIGTGDNPRLLQNVVDWLAGDSFLAELRDRQPRMHPVEITNPTVKSVLRFTAIFLPPLMAAAIGAAILLRRRNRARRR